MLVRTNKASFVLHFLCTWDRTQQTLSSFAWVLTDTTSMLHTMSILRWFGSHCTPGQHTKLGFCGVLLAASKLHNMIPGYSWVEMDQLSRNGVNACSLLANSTTRQKIELDHGHFTWCSIGLHHAPSCHLAYT